MATVNAILDAAFAIPALWLLMNDILFNPVAVAAADTIGGGAWLTPTMVIIALSIAIGSAWDAVDGFVKAYRNAARARSPV
jgi:hypothetical protein